jgi:hypothetical protein
MRSSAARLHSRHYWNAVRAEMQKLSAALILLKIWSLRLMAGASS